MTDYRYNLFKIVFMTLKNYMDTVRWVRDKFRKLPGGVVKKTYRYWNEKSNGHQCNIYYPEKSADPSSLPAIIDIHGGCWVHGDKDLNDSFNYDLVLKGNVVTTLTYRTIDDVHLKDQIQDIFAYLHFIEQHHEEVGIGLDEVMLTGDSAGAQLALLTWAIGQRPELQKLFEVTPVNFHVKCICLTHAVCFLDDAANVSGSRTLSDIGQTGLLRQLFGQNYETDPIYLSVNTPAKYLKGIEVPPVMIMTSQGDTAFSYQSERLRQTLKRLKIKADYYFEPDRKAAHVFNILDPHSKLGKKFNQAIRDFFKRVPTPA